MVHTVFTFIEMANPGFVHIIKNLNYYDIPIPLGLYVYNYFQANIACQLISSKAMLLY